MPAAATSRSATLQVYASKYQHVQRQQKAAGTHRHAQRHCVAAHTQTLMSYFPFTIRWTT